MRNISKFVWSSAVTNLTLGIKNTVSDYIVQQLRIMLFWKVLIGV